MDTSFGKRGSVAGVGFIIFLLILLGLAGYFLYLNLPGNPVDLIFVNEGTTSDETIEYATSKQFYDNMRFRDKKISYKIGSACDAKKNLEVEEVFSILESKTLLDFYPASSDSGAEITIFCSEIEPEPEREGYFVAGEGGPSEVINTTLYGVILSGEASFFREEKCDSANIALHEILHVLGFDHNNNPDSILFPTLDCDQTLDNSIVDDINLLYSVESAPDLKIVDVSATKSGRYLDFSIEVINQGLQDADNVVLNIYADDEFVKNFDLDKIKIGTKKFLDVTNLKISRSDKKIAFVVDANNVGNELFENNNKIELVLAGG